MYKMLYILIFSTLLFSCSDLENLDSTNSEKQDPIRLALVQIGGKWGYINREGEIVIEPQFDDAGDFSKERFFPYSFNPTVLLAVEGLAGVKIGNKYGYINREGKFFDRVRSFSEGLACRE